MVGKPRGRPWKKGHSGNPSGRRPTPPDVKEALQALTVDAVKVLGKILRGEIAGPAAGPRARAAETVLNRVYGTPLQSVRVEERQAFVALLPAKIEDPDEWERQAQKILGASNQPPAIVDIAPEPGKPSAELSADEQREMKRRSSPIDPVEFAADAPRPGRPDLDRHLGRAPPVSKYDRN